MRGNFTHLRRLLLASIACVLGAAVLTYLVDPLQLFRPSRLPHSIPTTRACRMPG